MDSHGLQAANHEQRAGSDRSDSVLARHEVFKRRAPVARRRDTTPRRSSRAATASAMLARLRVQVHALTVDFGRISHIFFCVSRCSHFASGRYFFQSLAFDNLASVHGDLWKKKTHSFFVEAARTARTRILDSISTSPWSLDVLRQSTETFGRITQFPPMLPALFALEIWTFSMSPSYLSVTCTSMQFEVVCCAPFCGIFRTPSTWPLSPSRADAGSHPSCWATRIRGQCTSTRPLDQCTGHCCTNPQLVDIHTVNESVRSNNNISNNSTPPDKEGVEGKQEN